jgi:hypothetical protein
MEASVYQARLSFLSVVSEEGDILNKHSFKSFACSSAAQNVENDCLQMERLKVCVLDIHQVEDYLIFQICFHIIFVAFLAI